MKLIGVTGTNGKTTIGYMMYQMMTMLDIPCAYMGTIGFYYCGNFINYYLKRLEERKLLS